MTTSAATRGRSVCIRARFGVPRTLVSSEVGLGAMPTFRRAAIVAADVHLISPAGNPSKAWGAVGPDGASCCPGAALQHHGFVSGPSSNATVSMRAGLRQPFAQGLPALAFLHHVDQETARLPFPGRNGLGCRWKVTQ